MNFRSLAVPCVVALFACSSDPTTPTTDGGGTDAGPIDGGATGPDYKAGTRLHPRVFVSPDGGKIIHGFYDTQLKIDCEITTADDGISRCLPPHDRGSLGFSDAACTKPVALVFDACPLSYIGTLVGSCGIAMRAVTTTKNSATTFYDMSSGSCAAYPGTPMGAYDSGPKLDATGFVKATRTREARGSALMMEFWDTEDGARMPIGAYDVARKSMCASSVGFDEPVGGHCVPTHVGYAEGQFADASCTVAAALLTGTGCNFATDDVRGSAWVYGKKPNCPYESRIGLASISQTTLSQAYEKSGNTCGIFPSPGQFAAVTADLPLSALPLMKPTPEGAGRIVRHVEQTPTGEKLLAERFYDTTLKAPCDAKVAADGKLRCVPVGENAFWYLDAACTQPLWAANGDAGCAYTAPEWLLANTSDAKVCPGYTSKVFKVGGKIANPGSVYAFNGTTCEANAGSPNWIVYGTTEQPASSLAELTDVTE